MANDIEGMELYTKSQRNYATITLCSDWKKTQGEKQNNFVISSLILVKRAAKQQLLTLLFQKSKDENKSQIQALLIGETTTQLKSEQIKSNVGFWRDGKLEYQRKNLSSE